MADDVSIERAWREINSRAPGDVSIATLHAAQFLLQQDDPKRLQAWLANRENVAAIRKLLRL
jgi:hypothetical protein